MNIMKFNKAKCKILHLDWGNPQYQYRVGGQRDGEKPCRKGLGYTDGRKAGNEPPMCTCSPVGQPYSALHQKKRGQQLEGGDSAALHYSGEIPPGVLCPALESSAQERHGAVGVGPEEGHQIDQRAGTPVP